MQSSGDEGVVLVSLGTTRFPSKSILDRLQAALVTLPYKVRWRRMLRGCV